MDRLDGGAFTGNRVYRAGRWVVCFAADWCPFCREFLERFERFKAPDGVHVAIGDVTDLDNPVWEAFTLDVVPTLAVFENGELTWRRDGQLGRGLSDEDLQALLAELRVHPGTGKKGHGR